MLDRFDHWFEFISNFRMSGYAYGTWLRTDKRRRVSRLLPSPRTLEEDKRHTGHNFYGIICLAAYSIQRKTDPGMMPSTRREAARTPPQMALPHLGASSGCRASLSWV